jgi:hypothetical protein
LPNKRNLIVIVKKKIVLVYGLADLGIVAHAD